MSFKIGDLQQIKGGEYLTLSERGEAVVSGRGFKGWLKVQWLNVKMFFSRAERARYMEQNRRIMDAFIQKGKDVYGERWGYLAQKRLQRDIMGGRRLTGFKIQTILKEAHKEVLDRFRTSVDTFRRTLFRQDPDKYISSAAEAVKTWKEVFSKYQAEGLSCPREVMQGINEIKNALQNLTERSVGVLSDKNLQEFKETLSALGLHHLDRVVDQEIEKRINATKARAKELTTTILTAISEGKDLSEILNLLKEVKGVLEDLFKKAGVFHYEGFKNLSAKNFMEFFVDSCVRGKDNAFLKNMAQAYKNNVDIRRIETALNKISAQMKQKDPKLADELKLYGDFFKYIRESAQHYMISRGIIKNKFSEPPVFLNSNIVAVIKDFFGCELKEFNAFNNHFNELVNVLSQEEIPLEKVLEKAYSVNSRFYIGVADEVAMDVDKRVELKKERMREALLQLQITNEQILKIYTAIISPGVIQLREELAALFLRASETEAENIALGRLRTTAETLDVLENLLQEEIARRGLDLARASTKVPTTSVSRKQIEQLVNETVEKLNKFFVLSYGQEVKKEINNPAEIPQLIRDMLKPTTTEVTTRTRLQHPDNREEVEVCNGFYNDFTRAAYKIMIGNQAVKINPSGSDVPEKEEVEGILRLKKFLGVDDEYFFKISQFANQFSLASITTYMGYAVPEKSLFIINGKRFAPVGFQFTTYTFAKNEKGEVELQINVMEELRGVLDLSEGLVIPVDKDSSYYNYGLSLVIPKEGNVEVKSMFYRYNVYPGFDLSL